VIAIQYINIVYGFNLPYAIFDVNPLISQIILFGVVFVTKVSKM